MAIPMVGVLYGTTIVVDVLAQIYAAYREKPDQKLAQHLRAAKIGAVQRKVREAEGEERIEQQYADLRRQRLQDLVGMKEGLDTGVVSPAQLGIKGGGLAARDMPMVNAVAARLGMDPQDLVARFDPSRSNMYVPESRRGNRPRVPLKQAVQDAQPPGPAQLDPTLGFGA